MESPQTDFAAILRRLADHSVDFIIVGGVCAVLHGAPVSTFDLDVVHSRDRSNVERLLKALGALYASYRGQVGRKLLPESSHLESAGHQILMTRYGPLDLLGALVQDRTYEDLLPLSSTMELGSGLNVSVLGLKALIEIKGLTGWERDKAVLPILKRTLEETSDS